MSFCVVYVLTVFLIQDIIGQILQQTGAQVSTLCSEGLLDGKDTFKYQVTVNTTGVNKTEWSFRQLEFQIQKWNTDNFMPVSLLSLESCGGTEQQMGTYCVPRRDNPDIYDASFHLVATHIYSRAEIRLLWTNRDQSKTVMSRTWQIPVIYDFLAVNHVLQVNGQQVYLESDTCYFPMRGQSNYITYCCSNAPAPCELSIYLNDQVTTAASCVNMTQPVSACGLYKFSLVVCKTTEIAHTCIGQVSEVSKPTLKVNDAVINVESEPCNMTLTREQNSLVYCCPEPPTPCCSKNQTQCQAYISSSGRTVFGSPCAYMSNSRNTLGNYSFAHSECGNPQTVLTCSAVPSTENTTSPKPSASTPTPNGRKPTLKLNDAVVNVESEQCKMTLTKEENTLVYCCPDPPNPCSSWKDAQCQANITSSGITVSGSTCAYMSILQKSTSIYSFAHSECGNPQTVLTCSVQSTPSASNKFHLNAELAVIFILGNLILGPYYFQNKL